MKWNRRELLMHGALIYTAAACSQLKSAVFAASPDADGKQEKLIVIFLRGGCDGLSIVAPADDKNYIAARAPGLRIGESGANAGLQLANPLSGGDFRLHRKAAALKELYDSRQLAIVHACGLKNATRSHFEAMSLIERGLSDYSGKLVSSGWIARHLLSFRPAGLLPAISTADATSDSLLEYSKAVSVADAGDFRLDAGDDSQKAVLRKMYQGTSPLFKAGQTTLDALDIVGKHLRFKDDGDPLAYHPDVEYPASDYVLEFSKALKTVAQLIKMEIGVQVATVDYGGWDTHENQEFIVPNLIDGLSRALHAFYADLSRYQNSMTILVMSEFGRRFKDNESGGTDHGHGNIMMLIGGAVNGGRLYGTWPGLATEQLDEGADLAVTTDYRTVIAEIITRRFKNPHLGVVFPGFKAYKPLGLVKGVSPEIIISDG